MRGIMTISSFALATVTALKQSLGAQALSSENSTKKDVVITANGELNDDMQQTLITPSGWPSWMLGTEANVTELPQESSLTSGLPSEIVTKKTPSQLPTESSSAPSQLPSESRIPSDQPSMSPSITKDPSINPTISLSPSDSPSLSPSNIPSFSAAPSISSAPSSSPVSFYVMGDIPYSPKEAEQLSMHLSEISDEADFIVHVGDMQRPQNSNCEPKAYKSVHRILRTSKIPVFVVPGDNDYLDCPDPIKAFSLWKKYVRNIYRYWEFPMPFERSKKRRENFAFFHKDVLFLGLNVINKHEEVLEDDLHFAMKHIKRNRKEMHALVIFGHYRIHLRRNIKLFAPIAELVKESAIPTVYIHGNGHHWYVEENQLGVPNLMRIQVDQGKLAPPVKVEIDRNQLPPFEGRAGSVARNGQNYRSSNIFSSSVFEFDRRLPLPPNPAPTVALPEEPSTSSSISEQQTKSPYISSSRAPT